MFSYVNFERYSDLVIPTRRYYETLNGKLQCTRITELAWEGMPLDMSGVPPEVETVELDLGLVNWRLGSLRSQLIACEAITPAGMSEPFLRMSPEDLALALHRYHNSESGMNETELTEQEEFFIQAFPEEAKGLGL